MQFVSDVYKCLTVRVILFCSFIVCFPCFLFVLFFNFFTELVIKLSLLVLIQTLILSFSCPLFHYGHMCFCFFVLHEMISLFLMGSLCRIVMPLCSQACKRKCCWAWKKYFGNLKVVTVLLLWWKLVWMICGGKFVVNVIQGMCFNIHPVL